MKNLRAMAASHAGGKLQNAHHALIDIMQAVRNEYTETERMTGVVEGRISAAFDELQEGRNWVAALAKITE
jgi:hypothetical protein